MKVKDIIYLEDNEKYNLISSVIYQGRKYFLAAGYKNENDIDMKKLVVLELVSDMEVKIVTDDKILMILTPLF